MRNDIWKNQMETLQIFAILNGKFLYDTYNITIELRNKFSS